MTSARRQRIFVTGGNGYIGSVLTEFAIADGHAVHALSRTEESDANLKKLGAVPVRGDLTSLEVIREESAAADVIILLASAFTIQIPSYDDVWPIDKASLQATADAVQGTDKPVLLTTATLMAEADPSGGETDETAPRAKNPLNTRYKAEDFAHQLAIEQGINIMIIRLAPYVYGRGGSGVKMFMGMGKQAGCLPCIDGGNNHITAVHVDDAARLYLLAAQHGRKNEVYNSAAETNIILRQLLEAMAKLIGVPVKDFTFDEAVKAYGPLLAKFLTSANRASGAKAEKELGWKPRRVGILEDVNNGSYLAVAATLKNHDA